MKGLIFSVKRYSIHDGPGIRVTFFMKGCSLSCWWCHNPEGMSPDPQAVETIEKVGGREFIKKEVAGKYYSVQEVISILESERIFITQSKGGVTFSGGEPMLQAEFIAEALKECRAAGFHTALDTSGQSQPAKYQQIIPYTDLFLFDLKHPDNEQHLKYTGVSNSLIISNLRMILDKGKEVYVRIPVVPGINDSAKDIDGFIKILEGFSRSKLQKICLLPYHKIGASKYKRFGIPSRMTGINPPSKERMSELKLLFEQTGIKVKIGG